MAISGINKKKSGEGNQHPGSPVQSPSISTLNIFQNNQPEDWEKKVPGSQHLPFIYSPEHTPKKSRKRSQCKFRHQSISIPPLMWQQDFKSEDHFYTQALQVIIKSLH